MVLRTLALLCALLCLVASPAQGAEKKVGVLLVSHGSRSDAWRKALTDMEDRVRPAILKDGSVASVKTAFMEYTEPSIATRLKEFDAAGFTDVVVVPVFLTVSPHTWDDIPTIIGQKEDPHSMEQLKLEKIERYQPKARTRITPPLDFPDILKGNIVRRVKALSQHPSDEGLVLIAYGDQTYEKQWTELLNHMAEYVAKETSISTSSHGWCGHLVHYDSKKTTEAIDQVLAQKKTAIVIPVLVAYDEMFQVKIIGDGIAKVANHESRVRYRPDSILPDAAVDSWIQSAALREAHAVQ